MVEEWVEEWLFRGRPPSGPGSDMPRDYQVMIGWQAPSPRDPNKRDRGRDGPYTPAQAEALGHSITTLVEGVNAAAIEDVAMLTGQLALAVEHGRTVEEALQQMTQDRQSLSSRLDEALAQAAALEAERNRLTAVAAEQADTIANRDAEIVALLARIADLENAKAAVGADEAMPPEPATATA